MLGVAINSGGMRKYGRDDKGNGDSHCMYAKHLFQVSVFYSVVSKCYQTVLSYFLNVK